MTLRNRFTLIGLGIVLFLIATPMLILYARGFKFDFATWQITKTGALVVKTDPPKAQVFLNDKLQSGTTPSTLRFLTPADYTVRVEKDGYQSWTKRFSVKSQLVTWAAADRDAIALFLKQPQLVQTWNTVGTSLSKLGTEIAFLDNKQQAATINTSNGDVSNLGSISTLPQVAPNTTLVWQNGSAVFQLLQSRNKWGLTDQQINQLRRGETNGTHTVALIGSDLYSLDLATPTVLAKSVSIFTLDGSNVWFLQTGQLKQFSFSSSNTTLINTHAPTGSPTQLIRANNQIYVIVNQTLFVLNDTFEKIYSPVNNAAFDAASGLLLFDNPNEIWTYNPTDKTTELILRSASPINNPQLSQADGYVLFDNEGQIKAIELDGRDHRNIYTLTPDLGNFTLSADGRTLYTFNNSQIKQYVIH